METKDNLKEPFHSGKRLKAARQYQGIKQEALVRTRPFPHINPKTLRRWEKGGINQGRIDDVASFFRLPGWVFKEKLLSEEQFYIILANPGLASNIKNQIIERIRSEQLGIESPLQNRRFNLDKSIVADAARCIRNNQADIFQRLLDQGLDVNQVDDMGWSLLSLAAFYNRVEIGQMLLDRRADPDFQDNNEGFSPAIIAAANNKADFLEFITPHCYLEQRDKKHWTALTWAAANNFLAPMRVLLANKANPDVPDLEGETPLMRAVIDNFSTTLSVLLQYGANVNLTDQNGRSALFYAVGTNNPGMCLTHQESGADPYAIDHTAPSPFTEAETIGGAIWDSFARFR